LAIFVTEVAIFGLPFGRFFSQKHLVTLAEMKLCSQGVDFPVLTIFRENDFSKLFRGKVPFLHIWRRVGGAKFFA
jgi:hypothetical protein